MIRLTLLHDFPTATTFHTEAVTLAGSQSLFRVPIDMPAVFDHSHRVRQEDIDGVGHVNNLVYVRWLQDAAVAHSAAQGWPTSAYYELGQGWVVRSHFIEYLSPAFANDEVVVRTWVSEMKRVTSSRRYYIIRVSDGKVLVKAETQWAFVAFTTLQPCRAPEEVVRAFEIPDQPPGADLDC